MQRKLVGITSVDLYAKGQMLIIYSALVKYFRKNENTSSASAIYRLQESLYVIQLGGRSCIIFSLRLVSSCL
jgi:predicted Zn-dependent protease